MAEKKKAPVKLTGGEGFRYEDFVAARFVLDMLAGTNSLGQEFGRVRLLDWQAREAKWLADDLALLCIDTAGNQRAVGVSIKSNQQVTSSGFPADFIEIAWRHWLGEGTARKLEPDKDAIVLVTAHIASSVEAAWSRMLAEAIQTRPERMVARLSDPADKSEGVQSSKIQRALFDSFRCPESLRDRGQTGDVASIQMIRQIRLLNFDFGTTTSRDEVRAISDCQRILRSGELERAKELWDRLVSFASENRVHGGSAELPGILSVCRGDFELTAHPDYRHDLDTLDRYSRDAMEDVHAAISDLPPLPRTEERKKIVEHLATDGICLMAGDSGSGKSALAKQISSSYQHTFWMSQDTFEGDGPDQIERRLSLHHPMREILIGSPGSCLIVFDGVESYAESALRLTAHLIRDLKALPLAKHVHVIVTAQSERMHRIVMSLGENGVPIIFLEVTQIPRPEESRIGELLTALPEIQWTALRPELRPLLTNLKVLDWVVAAARTGLAIRDLHIVGLTTLIDGLWRRWIEGDDEGYSRSHLLMQLATIEAEGLSAGVPRMRLGHVEQQSLPALIGSGLIRVRDERVRFSHDLLGDWARMRVLVGENPMASQASQSRAASPRWHRAVRLFGQRLLEQDADGTDKWWQAIKQLEGSTDSGQILRDLILESVFVATNALELLNRVWPALTSNDGHLLNRLLHRFLFVATVPDLRIRELSGSKEFDPKLEEWFRIPLFPYWGPVLDVLHAHRGDVVALAPLVTAQICSLWLRTVPTDGEPGSRLAMLRQKTAELAVAIAREVQGQKVEGIHFAEHGDRLAYEAALYAAPDLPDAVVSLSLELARRREPDIEVRNREERATQAADEARRRWEQENPEQAQELERRRSFLSMPLFGPLRKPWPDGPSERVDNAFREACLETPAFAALVSARPDAALEILFAICIEEPQREDPNEWSLDEDCSVETWFAGYPPLYFRGPFLLFLRAAPNQGLSFVLRLINFASHRYVERLPRRLARLGIAADAGVNSGVTVLIDGQSRRWLGDQQVFRWHNDWPHKSTIITSALMALEKWLYEEIDAGRAIDGHLARILSESESLAFAGLLLAVGKRRPSLFQNPLRPLLTVWELYQLDLGVTVQQTGINAGLIAWNMRGGRLEQLAREWFAMPHRQHNLRDVAVQLMLFRLEMASFFDTLRDSWSAQLDDRGEPESLRLLIERLNPGNYSRNEQTDGTTKIEFHWPEAIERKNAEDMRRNDEQLRLTLFPMQCRKRLNEGEHLTGDELATFWEFVSTLNDSYEMPADEMGRSLMNIEDCICAGIAVLVILHSEWLASDPAKLAWCRAKLQEIIQAPPRLTFLDSEDSIGDRHWDGFAAEAGVALLVERNEDDLARQLVASGIGAFRYSTVALTINRAFRSREKLGADFDRMLALAVSLAGSRSLIMRATHLRLNADSAIAQADSLINQFIRCELPVERPSLHYLNDTALAGIEAQNSQRRSSPKSTSDVLNQQQKAPEERKRVRASDPAIDVMLIAHSCRWLDLQSAQSNAERQNWLSLIRELAEFSLSLAPNIEDPEHDTVADVPSRFDGWVFAVVARAIPCMQEDERPDSLWQPIMNLPAPAHDWVERFFWEWFTDGVQAAASPAAFVDAWLRMIKYALQSPGWDPAKTRLFELDDMVYELLGFHFGCESIGDNQAYIDPLRQMIDTFAMAGQKWFKMPKVMNGFARFVVRPAARRLLLPGIAWLADAVQGFDFDDSREDTLEDNLVGVLSACWEREQTSVSQDSVIHQSFIGLLTALASRGGHAASALRDRVLDSISGMPNSAVS